MIAAIVPVYNAVRHLPRAVNSCIAIPQISEIIIVDDGSTDGSLDSIQDIEDPRIRIVYHQDHNHLGRSASRNLGIRVARSHWIIFCDADDYLLPHRLQHLDLTSHDKDIVDGFYDDIVAEVIDDSVPAPSILRHTGLTAHVPAEDLFEHLVSHRESWSHLNGLTIKRETLVEVGLFDTSFAIAEDTDLFWRLARHYTLRYGEAPSPVAVRCIHSDNTYHNEDLLIEGRYYFYEKWYQRLPHLQLSSKAIKRITSSYSYYRRKYMILKAKRWIGIK